MIVSVSLVSAQTGESSKAIAVPQALKASFAKDYPSIKSVKWDVEDGDYEVSFKLNGVDASVTYDKSGHKKDVEVAIKTAELPAVILEYIKKNYATYKLIEAATITNDKKELTYEAEVGKNGKTWDLLFDTNGKFLKQVAGD